MSQPELLKLVVETLDRIAVPYMVTGSVVSSLQGQPRSTHDIDLVVKMSPSRIPQLIAAFPPPDYYLSADSIREAIQNRSMFNLVSTVEGDKVDFWMLTDEPFDQSRFARKRINHLLGMDLAVSAPEDTILAKLRWAQMVGGSEKQFTDALRVFELQGESLDSGYIDKWAKALGIEQSWQQLKLAASKE